MPAAPARWYLRMPPGSTLPAFAEPDEALGGDMFEHLPDGPEGRRWRALLSEAQVVLHNHPRNAERAARGLPPVNSLWFWGAGVLPDHVRSPHAQVRTNDPALQALAASSTPEGEGSVLVDYRALATFDASLVGWLDAATRGEVARLVLDFADGARLAIEPRQRWRFWRRPMQDLAA